MISFVVNVLLPAFLCAFCWGVTPYLDNRDSFRKWMHFIHNKINEQINKKEISYANARTKYMEYFKPKPVYVSEKIKIQKHYIYSGLIISSFLTILFTL